MAGFKTKNSNIQRQDGVLPKRMTSHPFRNARRQAAVYRAEHPESKRSEIPENSAVTYREDLIRAARGR